MLGLPGKSFVPLLVGFGCTVPAVMATRTLETGKERFMTVFMAPFMSCGARLPVYALFAAAFFSRRAGLVVFSLYITGIVLAVLTGLLMKRTLFKGEASSFIMELPPYHRPRFRHIMIHTWDRLKGFILRAGKVIIIVVALLSVLNSIGTDGSFGNEDSEESVLSFIGKAITPVFTPMGVERDNWPATVGIFTGLFAKEAVVGTLDVLYAQMEADSGSDGEEEGGFDFWGGILESLASIPEGLSGIFGGLSDPLGTGLLQDTDTDTLAEEIGAEPSLFGSLRNSFSRGGGQAYAYLLFILLYFPCIAAFGAVVKETGVLFGLLNGLYLTVLAWITATLFYQVVAGHQLIWILVPLILLGGIILSFYLMGRKKAFQSDLKGGPI
jgi:ferrous iron transport protein B